MRARPFSSQDPGNIFYERPGLASTSPYTDVTGKTSRPITINPGEKTLVLIAAGQSLGTDLITDVFTPTNAAKVDNVCWYDGTCWAATTPLLGTSWNGTVGTSVNFNHRIADGIISNGKFARVILIPMGMSGTTVGLWANQGIITTEAVGYWRMIVAIAKKLAAQGITPTTPNVSFLVKWNQGESDTQQATSQVNYATDFAKMVNQCAAALPGVKWMVAKESWYIGATSAAVQAAQLGLVNGISIVAGENMDSIDNTGRVGDQTHLNAAGGLLAASMGVAAISAVTF